jgi:hypothetical protein
MYGGVGGKAREGLPIPIVPGMAHILWVKVPVQEAIRRTREAQGRSRETGSGGSVNQNCEPMNKKRI